jgi:hypothetical protein
MTSICSAMVGDGLPNQFHCKIMAAGLLSNDPEKMERVGMVWLRRKDLAAKRLGFGQSTGLMVL